MAQDNKLQRTKWHDNNVWSAWREGANKVDFETERQADIYLETGLIFTVKEANAMAKKIQFVESIQALVTSLAQVADQVDTAMNIYSGRGYDEGITADEISSTECTPDDVAEMMAMLEQFSNFMNNRQVTEAAYRDTANLHRTDV